MKLAAMVPAFQYSSIYVVTGKVGRLVLHDSSMHGSPVHDSSPSQVGRLLDDPALQRRCEISTRCGGEGSGQGGEKLFSLYCDLIPRQPYNDVDIMLGRFSHAFPPAPPPPPTPCGVLYLVPPLVGS